MVTEDTDIGWTMGRGDSPLVATAIHAGHGLRAAAQDKLIVDAATRAMEEDPLTERFLGGAPLPTRDAVDGDWPGWRWSDPERAPDRVPAPPRPRVRDLTSGPRPLTVSVTRSRFEADLNRPRDRAVYLTPADAWGHRVWRRAPESEDIDAALAYYDGFYGGMERTLQDLQRTCGGFVLLDLHSYCHRRGGPEAAPDAPSRNPEINVGTGSIENPRWRGVVERFMDELRAVDFGGRSLDVRENVKFAGGHFPQWVNQRFGRVGCALAIEVKKIYLDEWTQRVDWDVLARLRQALQATLPGLLEELARA